jgi:hypothetical protein
VLLVGGVLSWQAYQQQQAFEEMGPVMGTSMGAIHGTNPLWSSLAYAVAALGVGATHLAYRESSYAKHVLATFGILAFPLGLPVLVDAYGRQRTEDDPARASRTANSAGIVR